MYQSDGNLLEVERGILGHQVNTQGVMGHDIANQIRLKWPAVYEAYRHNTHRLGDCFIVKLSPNLYIANLYGQGDVGITSRKTHYGALAFALVSLRVASDMYGLPVYLPYGMSCDLAGGDWTIVSEMISFLVPQATIVKLPRYNRATGMPG